MVFRYEFPKILTFINVGGLTCRPDKFPNPGFE